MPRQPDMQKLLMDKLQTFPSVCALGEQYVEHIAQSLLSLPGIAIVQLPEPKTVKPGLVLLHDGWVSAWRARELAAELLAGAAAAEADHA